jgi:hypothetical protein
MQWYVFYGSGRILRAAGSASNAPNWTLKPFESEQSAIVFAIDRVNEGLSVKVGALGENIPPKYQTADIAAMVAH